MNEDNFPQIRVRSAPSPTGRPHIGTAYNALFNYIFAKKHGGKFILRIEDTDRKRFVPGAEKEIYEAFSWLGLEPDESPEAGGEFGPYRQSERLGLYQKYAEKLVAQGDAYYCFCSKERLKEVRRKCREEKRPPMYDEHCRQIDSRVAEKRAEADESYVIRLKVPREGSTRFVDLIRGQIEVENKNIDDQVLLKSDGFPTYHLANVVDDHLMKISHIIRGEEWLSSVPKHIILYNAFGWKPPVYAHTPLLRGKDKSKLGKRHGALPILDYREQGILPEALLNYLSLLGWTHPEEKEFFDLSELTEKFALKDIDATAPVFDSEKLRWLTGKWIRDLSVEELAGRTQLFFEQGAVRAPRREVGFDNRKVLDSSPDKLKTRSNNKTYNLGPAPMNKWIVKEKLLEIIPLVQERMETLADFEDLTEFFFEAPEIDPELLIQKGRTKEETKEMFEAAQGIIGEGNLDRDHLEKEFRSAAEEHGWKMGEICMTARVAITGKAASPPLFESIAVLGGEEVRRRLAGAIGRLL